MLNNKNYKKCSGVLFYFLFHEKTIFCDQFSYFDKVCNDEEKFIVFDCFFIRIYIKRKKKKSLWLFPCVHMLINTGIILAGINSIEPCSHTQLVICKSQKLTTSRFYWIYLLMIFLWFQTINRGITRIVWFFDMWSKHLKRISERKKGKSHETLYIFTEKSFSNPAKLTQHNAFLTQTRHFLLGNFNTYRIWNLISLFEICLHKQCTKCRLWISAFKGNHFEYLMHNLKITTKKRIVWWVLFLMWWNLMRNKSLLNYF